MFCRKTRPRTAAEPLERRTLFAVATVDVSVPAVGASETGPVDSYVTLTRTGGDITVPLAVSFTLAGSATNGVDYETIGTQATIPAGASWTHVPVHVIPDTLAELSEVVLLRLTAAPGYALGQRTSASVIIRDDFRTIREWGEPNEDWREPTPLGDQGDGPRWVGMAIDPNDVDIYRVHSRDDGTPLEAMIEFDHRLGDLNLALLNDVGNRELARSAGAGDVERVTLPSTPGETYLLKVWGEGGATNLTYSIDVRPVPAGPSFHMVHRFLPVDFNEVRFPPAATGKTSQATATLINVGDQPLELGPMNLPAGFQVVEPAKATLAPGESDTVTFAWAGAAVPGVHAADVTFGTNEPGVAQRALRLITPATGVASRTLFYNNSAADNNTPQFTSRDLAATDPAKRALTPGEAASVANVSNYSKGINGVLLTLVRPGYQALTPQDFAVRYSGPDGRTWVAAPDSLNVLSSTAGYSASHVSLIWPDYVASDPLHVGQAIGNGWLEVTVKANERTGLATPETFYFGNLVGDTGDDPARPAVNALDLAAVRRALNTSPADWRYDINRDGAINALDLAIVRANLNRRLGPPPAPAPAALFSADLVETDPHDHVAALLE